MTDRTAKGHPKAREAHKPTDLSSIPHPDKHKRATKGDRVRDLFETFGLDLGEVGLFAEPIDIGIDIDLSPILTPDLDLDAVLEYDLSEVLEPFESDELLTPLEFALDCLDRGLFHLDTED